MKDKIIGFFNVMRSEFDSEFSPIIRGLSSAIEKGLRDSYGVGLDLLLVQYRFDGFINEFSEWPRPVSNYNKNDKSIAVKFIVRHKDFHNRSTEERKQYFQDTVLRAIELARDRLKRNKAVKIDFDLLYRDTERILDDWKKK